MSVESSLCNAVAQAIIAAESDWPFLGKSLAVHAQVADGADATIVRGGQGRCLVRLSSAVGNIDAGYENSARETVLIDLEIEVSGAGGTSATRRNDIIAAVKKTFAPPGDTVMGLVHDIDDNGLAPGMAGAVVGIDMNFDSSGDVRNPRATVTIQFSVWTARAV